MLAFEYSALDSKGRTRKGVLEGDHAGQIRRQLREQGLSPLQVEAVAQSAQSKHRGPRIKSAEMALFTRQLATLIGAGLTLENSLQTVAKQHHRAALQSLLLSLRAKVVEGHSLADAMAQFPRVFPELYRASVAAGEQAGALDKVLNGLADYSEARHRLRQKILLALFYPLILTLVAVLIVIGLMLFVVPQVVQVFAQSGQNLPLLTQVLIDASAFLQAYGGYVFLGLLLSLFMGIYAWRIDAIREQGQRLLLRLPLLGRLSQGINTSRFTQSLSMLSAGGVPLLDALRISAEIIPNRPIRRAIEFAATQVREGGSLHQALAQSQLFPAVTLSLIASGESSGQLQQLLAQAAKNQTEETQNLINLLLAIFEPLLILVMGLVVLLIVLAILMPIFELNQLVR